MKNTRRFYAWLLGIFVVLACKALQPSPPLAATPAEDDFLNLNAWRVTWRFGGTFDDVTVTFNDAQKTYPPEQENYVFLAMQAEIENISDANQEMRFLKEPIYLEDQAGHTYNLAGIAQKDTILMAPPYLLVNTILFTTAKWENGGFFTVAYLPDPGGWSIQASPQALFYVDFLFTCPRDVLEYTLHFGKRMTVTIKP